MFITIISCSCTLFCTPPSRITYPDGQKESVCDVANAIAEIISNVYRFGVAQFSDLASAIERVIMDGSYARSGFSAIERVLTDMGTKSSLSVAQRLHALFQHNVFQAGESFMKEGRINIIDLSKYDTRTQNLAGELLLYHLWHTISAGNGSPIFICVDEFQNLGLSKTSMLAKMLAEGRKYGLNLILVTQSLGIHFTPAQEKLLCQTRFKLFFRPSDADARHVAALMSEGNTSSVVVTLKRLKTGQCLLSGPVYIGDDTQPVLEPILLSAELPTVAAAGSDTPKAAAELQQARVPIPIPSHKAPREISPSTSALNKPTITETEA